MKIGQFEGWARDRQRGTVLVVGLVVLLVMTLLGITSMQNTVLEERMAGNVLDRNLAFHAAEAGIQLALSFIEGRGKPPMADGTGSQNVWPGCGVRDDNDPRGQRLCTVY